MRANTTTRVIAAADAPPDLLDRIRTLLIAAFDGDFSDDDWQHTVGGRHIVVLDGDNPVAHAAVITRTITVADLPFTTGYVEGVASAPARRGEGFGSMAMAEANRLIRARFDLGVLSTDAHHFYERLGWERWHGPAYVRRSNGIERTADEDDGIMVLRCAATTAIDLGAAVTCVERPGDDW